MNIYNMTVIELLLHSLNGFLYFLMGIGILTFFFPIKISVHPPQGILLGVGFTSSFSDEPQLEDIKYIFFSVHLILFSLGIFINLGERHD
jgi:hypothetical protein